MTTQTQPIELHSFPTPNGKKITVMLEELGVPYTHHLVHIGRDEQFRPEFLAISPNNKIPAIVDPDGPDGEPIAIFESGAILKYLGQKFRRFYPLEMRKQVAVDEWLFWQVSGFGPMLGQADHFIAYAGEQIPYAIKRYTDEVHRLFRVLDTQLRDAEYVAGEISIADFALVAWSNKFESYDIDLDEFPHFAAWNQRMNQRPATRKGLDIIQV